LAFHGDCEPASSAAKDRRRQKVEWYTRWARPACGLVWTSTALVKQELFAHFVLITLNRLFANRADLELNSGQRSPSGPNEASPQHKTNFKNAIHVLERGLEELLLLQERMKGVVQRVFRTVLARHQRVRPNRSYVRRSMRPATKWKLSKEKKQAQKAAATTLA
jgi:hypothetical protein